MGFFAALTIVLSVCFWVAVGISIAHGMDRNGVILISITLLALTASFAALFIVSFLKDKKKHHLDKDIYKKGKYHEE